MSFDRSLIVLLLITFAFSLGSKHLENYDVTRDTHPVAFSIPFNSDTKTALVIVKKENAGTEKTSASSLAVLVKGAPERVLDRCSAYLDSTGAVQPMSDEFKVSCLCF